MITGLEVPILVTASDDPPTTLPFSTQELGKLPVLRAFRFIDTDTHSNEMRLPTEEVLPPSDVADILALLQSTSESQVSQMPQLIARMNGGSDMFALNGVSDDLEFSWENWLTT